VESDARLDLLHVAAEIADLVQRIPRRDLHRQLSRHVGNFHFDVEYMPLGVGDRNFVLDGRCAGVDRLAGILRVNRSCNNQDAGEPQRGRLHCLLAPAGCGTPSANFLSSLSHRPSKLPLDMISSKSPGLASADRYSAILSAPSNACASLPSSRTLCATECGARRFSSPNCCARNTPPSTTRSASASAVGNVS